MKQGTCSYFRPMVEMRKKKNLTIKLELQKIEDIQAFARLDSFPIDTLKSN